MSGYLAAGFVFAKLAVAGVLIVLFTCWVSARLEARRRQKVSRSARAQLELARRAAGRVDAEHRAQVAVVRAPYAPAEPRPTLRRVS